MPSKVNTIRRNQRTGGVGRLMGSNISVDVMLCEEVCFGLDLAFSVGRVRKLAEFLGVWYGDAPRDRHYQMALPGARLESTDPEAVALAAGVIEDPAAFPHNVLADFLMENCPDFQRLWDAAHDPNWEENLGTGEPMTDTHTPSCT